MDQHSLNQHKYLFHQGRNYRSYEFLGAHQAGPLPSDGVTFRVWAPRAKSVSLVADCNGWEAGAMPLHPMEGDPSIWELTTDRMRVGDLYKYAVETAADSPGGQQIHYKADPFAFEGEKGSSDDGFQRASRVSHIAYGYRWRDKAWIEARQKRNPVTAPMNIYEVHLGSWKHHEDGTPYTYRQLAGELIPYAKHMGYTHLELLPLMEHPFDGSWGYQVTGYFAVTSRYGSPEDFKYFVDQAHRYGIGVIMDWVPAHFPKDEHGLMDFDGYPLYEDSDPLRMEHREWGTRAFDFGRPEVRSFLISSAFFFCDVYHIDGLRVDAVAAMLYLDYNRQEGQWRPNRNGGRENLEVISFLQNLNQDVLTSFPGVLTIAEESTDWPLVTKPPQMGGLGFNFKWNMGWMNDALEYFATDPLFRKGIHNKLTFSLTYAYSENYILPISHDEVVHGKRSLLGKMPGEYDDQFSGLRAFLTYMMTHPGKKLHFMGNEIGQFVEWDEKRELDWMLLEYDRHRQLQAFVKDLNKLYLSKPCLWIRDDSFEGFGWIDADNGDDNTYSYQRMAPEEPDLVVILNLSGRDFPEYCVGVPEAKAFTALVDTDKAKYGGTGMRRAKTYPVLEGPCNGHGQHIKLPLPAFSGIILEGVRESL